MRISLTCFALFFQVCLSHMELESPPPIRSRFNPFYDYSSIDYSYTEPLKPNGYPCKGYHASEPHRSVVNYTAGETQSLKLVGGADHKGGSCQISLSYDEGQSFTVIKSMIGGCPIKREYDFVIPESAPDGQALLSWSWINHEGNREFYQNCAWVNVISSNKESDECGGSVSAFSSQPSICKAHTKGECIVQEGYDYVYPEPGDQVEYGGDKSRYTKECRKTAARQLSADISQRGEHYNETKSGLHSMLRSQDDEKISNILESSPAQFAERESSAEEEEDAQEAENGSNLVDEDAKTVYETITEKETVTNFRTVYAPSSKTGESQIETSTGIAYPPTLPRSLLGEVHSDTYPEPTGSYQERGSPNYSSDYPESYLDNEPNQGYQPGYNQLWEKDFSYDDNMAYDSEDSANVGSPYADAPDWYQDEDSYEKQEQDQNPQEEYTYPPANRPDSYYRGNRRNAEYRYANRQSDPRYRRYRATPYAPSYPPRDLLYPPRIPNRRQNREYQA